MDLLVPMQKSIRVGQTTREKDRKLLACAASLSRVMKRTTPSL
ncbi:hypothetical protein LJR015_004555 [Peribacillus frigoritolerans]|nr:hypothetical protein [Peribacillus simplex]